MVSEFGKKIQMIQAEMDVSSNELARRLRKSRQSIHQLKKSTRPRPRTVYALARALNVPVRVFFSFE